MFLLSYLISLSIDFGGSSFKAAVARDWLDTFGSLLFMKGTVKGKFLRVLACSYFLASISASLSRNSFCSAYKSFIF